jgi:uncharacterized membrane protein YczE
MMIRRLIQLFAGLCLYGFSVALMIEAGLGLEPWGVFNEGVTQHTPLSFGLVVNIIGLFVLLLWIPLKQKPGIGTIANVLIIGTAVDVSALFIPDIEGWNARTAFLVAGVLLNGLAGGLYIGAGLGPGPRDGLMTGLHRRTGWPIRRVRTGIELVVLSCGFALGGTVGVGTVLYALCIGPIVQFWLPKLTVKAPEPKAVLAPAQ